MVTMSGNGRCSPTLLPRRAWTRPRQRLSWQAARAPMTYAMKKYGDAVSGSTEYRISSSTGRSPLRVPRSPRLSWRPSRRPCRTGPLDDVHSDNPALDPSSPGHDIGINTVAALVANGVGHRDLALLAGRANVRVEEHLHVSTQGRATS